MGKDDQGVFGIIIILQHILSVQNQNSGAHGSVRSQNLEVLGVIIAYCIALHF